MTDKERLEIIQDKILQMYALSSFDIKWLVEKAKKYQALVISDDDHKHYVKELREQNKQYREALEGIKLLVKQKFWDRSELEKGIKAIVDKALEREEK